MGKEREIEGVRTRCSKRGLRRGRKRQQRKTKKRKGVCRGVVRALGIIWAQVC